MPATAPNRLSAQSSAYLLQHAGQPVDWYPWGEEALERARREDRPILLSIGYAACHWCHVMAEESFSDPATAALMNEGFINIKVDREERPDLDALYQMAHQRLRRNPGGWPLTIFLSPQGVPFYSGTYFPREAQHGRPALREVLGSVSLVWRDRRPALVQQDKALLDALAASLPRIDPSTPERLDAGTLAEAHQRAQMQLESAFDAEHGGFGGAPRFPHPTDLAFLLRRGREQGDARALDMAMCSLRGMAAGGLYDQIGGGFFRYSVDVQWRIPHFEKMLYDNGMLLALYADALTFGDDPLLRRVVEDTAGWALREMQSADGGFCASLSADDANGREGAFYVWEPEPLRLALSPNEWDVCAAHWGLIDPPGFEGSRWHLRVARPAAQLAATLKRPLEAVEDLITSARAKLLSARDTRERPERDSKQLTGWSALMITGLARAATVCGRPDWLQAARAALEFLRTQRWQEATPQAPARLFMLADQPAFLDDHAFLLEAVLELHAADPQPADLPWAEAIASLLLSKFEHEGDGGFYFTPHDAPPLVHRLKSGVDAATPSGNGTAALALLRLDGSRYRDTVARCVRAFAAGILRDPASHTRLLLAASALEADEFLPPVDRCPGTPAATVR